MKFNRSSRNQIAHIMQLALVDMLALGPLPTGRAGTFGLITVFLDHFCFGQVFDPLIFGIRLILARTVFFHWLFDWSWRFHLASLLQITSLGHTFFDRLATVSNFAGCRMRVRP